MLRFHPGQFICCILLAGLAFPKAGSELKEVSDSKYKPGQVWNYKTRAGEESSTLTILRIDAMPDDKRIVHIRVDGIRLRNCRGGPEPDQIQHMPFERESLERSINKQIGTTEVPDFKEGYDEWRKGWDHGSAGIYLVTVAQAVDVAEKTFRQGIGCSN